MTTARSELAGDHLTGKKSLLNMLFCALLCGTSTMTQAISTTSSPGDAGHIKENPDAPVDPDLSSIYGDDETIRIATGTAKPIRLAPSVASVITSEQIRAAGATNLDEALEMVPGLHVSLSNSNRLNSVYSMRGIHTSQNPQVLMLVDGTPFSQYFSGARPTSFRLPVANIERIEVVRGPGSAVFGADAFSGVINIITKDYDNYRGAVIGGRLGSFDSKDIWIQHGKDWGDWKTGLSIEWSKSAGDSERIVNKDLTGRKGPLETRYKTLNSRLKLQNGNWTASLWDWRQIDAGVGAGAAQALDPDGRTDYRQSIGSLEYNNANFGENWEVSAQLHQLYAKEDDYLVLFPANTPLDISSDPGNTFGNPCDKECNTSSVIFPNGMIGKPGGVGQGTRAETAATYSGIDKHRLRLAAGIATQKLTPFERKNYGTAFGSSITATAPAVQDVTGTSGIYMDTSKRTLHYLSLQDEWRFKRDWELTGGLRYDHYSDFGYTVNPRLALVWNTSATLTSKLLYGRAFRAPSFAELHAKNNPVIIGNPDLKPETINTLELAFDSQLTYDLRTKLSLFAYQADDLIEYIPDAGKPTSTAQNALQQKGRGIELEARWKIDTSLRLEGNYAWQHSYYDNDTHVADAPGQQAYAALHYLMPNDWRAQLQAKWIGDRKRNVNDVRTPIADYLLVNLTLRKARLANHWEIAGSVRNLFDRKAQEPSGACSVLSCAIPGDYPLPGRSLFVELIYQPGA